MKIIYTIYLIKLIYYKCYVLGLPRELSDN